MTTFTISINKELKTQIDAHPEINWAEYLKQKFENKIINLKTKKKV
ncbi:MAG: hypothetical protein WC758_03305 [Candidatus Woesearchaeota archaeon]|jgi:hypothetical protein